MARSHARVLVSIWSDPHFVALDADEQRMYLLLVSQPDLSLCGALPLRPKRWARLCPNDCTDSVVRTLKGLERENYVMIDDDVDELWIRSFIKHDGLLKVPNMVKAMWNAFDQLLSEPIKESFREQFDQLVADGKTKPRGEGVGVGEGSAAPKMLVRCDLCNKLSMDCTCSEPEREQFEESA